MSITHNELPVKKAMASAELKKRKMLLKLFSYNNENALIILT